MNKEVYDIVKKYNSMLTNLYFKLDKMGIDIDKLAELYNELDEFYDQIFKIGTHLDMNKLVDKEGFLTQKYEGLPKYLKLTVLYEYDNGFSLCESTTRSVYLIPNEIISFDITD